MRRIFRIGFTLLLASALFSIFAIIGLVVCAHIVWHALFGG